MERADKFRTSPNTSNLLFTETLRCEPGEKRTRNWLSVYSRARLMGLFDGSSVSLPTFEEPSTIPRENSLPDLHGDNPGPAPRPREPPSWSHRCREGFCIEDAKRAAAMNALKFFRTHHQPFLPPHSQKGSIRNIQKCMIDWANITNHQVSHSETSPSVVGSVQSRT